MKDKKKLIAGLVLLVLVTAVTIYQVTRPDPSPAGNKNDRNTDTTKPQPDPEPLQEPDPESYDCEKNELSNPEEIDISQEEESGSDYPAADPTAWEIQNFPPPGLSDRAVTRIRATLILAFDRGEFPGSTAVFQDLKETAQGYNLSFLCGEETIRMEYQSNPEQAMILK